MDVVPGSEQPGQEPRQQQDARHRHDHRPLHQQRVAQPDGEHRPGVGAEEADLRRQVVRVAAEVLDRPAPLRALIPPGRLRRVGGIGGRDRFPPALGGPHAVGAEPAPDVAAPGNGRQVVDPLQQVRFQRFEDAETERRAANAAAGQGEAHQLVAGRRIVAVRRGDRLVFLLCDRRRQLTHVAGAAAGGAPVIPAGGTGAALDMAGLMAVTVEPTLLNKRDAGRQGPGAPIRGALA